ncbi:sel1 repeat family protein [bacterium]|nr:sel1 repeat family protein [bacterium]
MVCDIFGKKKYAAIVCGLALAGGLLYYGWSSHADDKADKVPDTKIQAAVVQRDIQKEEKLKKAAESGDLEAQYQLGKYYFELYKQAEYKSKDYKMYGDEILKWLKKPAEKGMAAAQIELNEYYLYGFNNFIEAALWLDKAVQQNSPKAIYEVGLRYQSFGGSWDRSHDIVITHDIYKAVDWWKRAAELGDADAQYALGLLYYKLYDGIGYVPYNSESGLTWQQRSSEAEKWLKAAAAQGHESAAKNLAWLKKSKVIYDELKKDGKYLEFFKNLDKAKSAPEYDVFDIRDFEPDGKRTVFCADNTEGALSADDEKLALEHLKEKAQSGNIDAQCKLAEMYLGMRPAAADIEAMPASERAAEAERWYAAAAEGGSREANERLTDLRKQMALLQKEEAGTLNADEEYELSDYYGIYDNVLFNRNKDKAQELLEKAASDGCAAAQYDVGIAYIRGLKIADSFTAADYAEIKPDISEAEKLLKAAAAQGHEEAADRLAELDKLNKLLDKKAENKLSAEDEYELSCMAETFPFLLLMSSEKKEKLLISAAERGCPKAWDEFVSRGDRCLTRIGKFDTDKQIMAAAQEALGYYRKAAAWGSAKAKEKLAEFDTQSAERQEIQELTERLAKDKTDAEAACRLALIYAYSYFNRDREKALPYFHEAARYGNTVALQELYFRSDNRANNWEKDKNSCGFSRLDEKDFEEKEAELLKEADSGSLEVKYKLGWLYYSNSSGSNYEKNINIALKYWTEAAEQGHSGAQLCLGGYHFSEIDYTDHEKSESEKWLTLAADNGEVYAKYLLALKIYYGYDEVNKRHADTSGFDLKKAFSLSSQAAEQGCADAQLLLGIACARGLGVQADAAKAEFWYGKADQNGKYVAVFYSYLTKTGLLRYRSIPGFSSNRY